MAKHVKNKGNTPLRSTTVSSLLGCLSHNSDDPFNPVHSEISLWRAVITQALMDASSNSSKTEAHVEKRRATYWLLSSKEDFETVCHYAHLDPNYVREQARHALARDCRWRAEPRITALAETPPAEHRAPGSEMHLAHYPMRTKRPASLPPLETKSNRLALSLTDTPRLCAAR